MTYKHIYKYFALLLLVSSCGKEVKEVKKAIRPVQFQEVGYIGGEKIRTFSGTAKTDKIINLSFRNNGIISKFNIRLGQIVKKGELLGTLDNVQSRLSYEQAVSSLNSAASQMNTAKLSLNRIRTLYEKGGASLSDFESAKNSYKTAQESHESAKRSVSIQEEQIRYGFLYAPENGIIATVNAEIDENVTAGQNIAVLNAGTDMEIYLGIPESVINRVKPKMKVEVSFTAIPNKKYLGEVTEISPSVDSNTATYPVRLKIINPSEEIKTGMAANVTFDFGSATKFDLKTLIVPAKAVGEDANGRFVFLIEDGRVKKQKIKVGTLTTNGFEILEGLKVGQKIATAGLQTLLDGQDVKM